jgi:hypothetical protein
MKRILLLFAALAVAALAVTAVASAHQNGHRGDRNRDGLPDKWERAHHLSLKVNQARRDQDNDGLDNRREFEHGTDPMKADTDDNGVDDENEVNPVGTIASFTNGTLTITLANGQTVSGQVTPGTEIKCENENEVENARAARHGDGDNSGPGSSGSDDGANHDAGDDHGDDGAGTTPTTTAPAQPSNSGPGSANSGPGNANGDDNDEHACGPNPLTAGAAVKQAEAKLTSGGLVFEEIELR